MISQFPMLFKNSMNPSVPWAQKHPRGVLLNIPLTANNVGKINIFLIS